MNERDDLLVSIGKHSIAGETSFNVFLSLFIYGLLEIAKK